MRLFIDKGECNQTFFSIVIACGVFALVIWGAAVVLPSRALDGSKRRNGI